MLSSVAEAKDEEIALQALRMVSPLPASTKRQQMLSSDQYEIVDVRTSRGGVRRAMLFPKAILQAELAANAPLRERMAIKRERMRAKRAAKQKRA